MNLILIIIRKSDDLNQDKSQIRTATSILYDNVDGINNNNKKCHDLEIDNRDNDNLKNKK